MVVGVNGTGKTTTIGKLAHALRTEGKTVLLCAADTFRAAAIEQLEIWGSRTGVEVIKTKPGGDPSAVLFDALSAAKARHTDSVIVDTAGRLHTKTSLMAELEKMKRTAQRIIPGAPHEVLLVMDATTGQNGLQQARQFTESAGVTGIVLTKLDGTAKGGVVIAISRELGLPVRYVGVGEKAGDLAAVQRGEFCRLAVLGDLVRLRYFSLNSWHFLEQDEQFMRQALELARRGTALTSPGARVGAVIADNQGNFAGAGFYTFDGIKHAEVLALEQAGRARTRRHHLSQP